MDGTLAPDAIAPAPDQLAALRSVGMNAAPYRPSQLAAGGPPASYMNPAPNTLAGLDPARQAVAAAARRQMIMNALAAQGQHGDTMLAHISPDEARALMLAGGAGTPNKVTHLPQFYGADDDALAGADPGELAGVSGVDTSGIGSSTPLPGSPEDQGGGDLNYEKAKKAWGDRDFWDKGLDLLGSLVGLKAKAPDPNDPASFAGGTYHTPFNPGGAIGSLAGLGLGIAGGRGTGILGPAEGALIGSMAGGGLYNKLTGPSGSASTPSTVGPAPGMPTDMSSGSPNVNAAYGVPAGSYPTPTPSPSINAPSPHEQRRRLAELGLLSMASNRSV